MAAHGRATVRDTISSGGLMRIECDWHRGDVYGFTVQQDLPQLVQCGFPRKQDGVGTLVIQSVIQVVAECQPRRLELLHAVQGLRAFDVLHETLVSDVFRHTLLQVAGGRVADRVRLCIAWHHAMHHLLGQPLQVREKHAHRDGIINLGGDGKDGVFQTRPVFLGRVASL